MNKFSQDIEKVLLPLKGFLTFNLIKTEEELMLTYAIMVKDYLIETQEDSKHKSREPKSFDAAKSRMVEWLETLKSRDSIFKEDDYDRLIEEIEEIELIERTTLHDTARDRKLHSWVPMYRLLEVGGDRALNIAKGIEKWVLHINPLILKNREYKDIKKFNTTRKNIDKSFHNKSIELYNLLDLENDKTTTEEGRKELVEFRKEKWQQKEHG